MAQESTSGAARPKVSHQGGPQGQVDGSEPREAEGRRLALVIEYDGTNYSGFQLQAGRPTIQGEIEKSLSKFTGESIRVRGASRTDSGAHAKGQVVDFLTGSAQPVEQFPKALNYYLPESIAVLGAKEMTLDFHSRKNAVSRTYRYLVLNREWKSPIRRNTHYWVRGDLQVCRMAAAARGLAGTHDFRVLAAGHPPGKSAVRRVYRWDVWREEDTVIIEAEAEGFLRQQIRKANALLIQVGKGRYPETLIDETLNGESPVHRECPPLPAHGLCLVEVKYPAGLFPGSGAVGYAPAGASGKIESR